MKHIRFTAKDDDVIKNIIEQHDSLKEAFEDAAIALNRTTSSIMNRYYTSDAFKASISIRRKKDIKRKNNVSKILVEELRNSPDNLQEAFRRTAARTNMSRYTIVNDYYRKGSYLQKSKIGVCFTLISGKKVIYNGKNSEKNQPKVEHTKSNRLINFFKTLFK